MLLSITGSLIKLIVMKNRQRKYFSDKKKKVISEVEVHEHADNKIDQDFPGFPYGQSKEKIINPTTETEKKVAAVDKTDGEKMTAQQIDESDSDASGGAFDATEKVRE